MIKRSSNAPNKKKEENRGTKAPSQQVLNLHAEENPPRSFMLDRYLDQTRKEDHWHGLPFQKPEKSVTKL
ncbi:hypothetical protein PABG_00860 [Paracoccidioides brasiliensis Pb03]|nr:hypothetical protein PABG_00860 [Paracoccidioides brasiliensis Pb03]